MFFKSYQRSSHFVENRTLNGHLTPVTQNVGDIKVINILDYMLAQAGDNEYSYVQVSVFNKNIFAILESGANGILVVFNIIIFLCFVQPQITNVKLQIYSPRMYWSLYQLL